MKFFLSTSSALAIAIMTPCAAFAQAEPAPEQTPPAEDGQASAGAADIIVTAQRRSERALDVPASLTVISGEALNLGGSFTSMNLTTLAPGLKMDRRGLNSYPAIRGVTSLVGGPGFDANVSTYVDGVYVSNPAAILDLPDVDSVVVLKGPQGTLFGRNATGGAIQISTKKPEFDLHGDASVSYGRFDNFAIKGFVTAPIVDDKIAASISAYHETRDGYLKDVLNDNKRVHGLKAQLVRGKILLTPTDNTEFVISGYYSYRSDPAGLAGTPYFGSSQANRQPGAITPSRPYEVAENIPTVERAKFRGLAFSGKVDTEIGEFTAIGAYNRHRTYIDNPAYGGFAPAGGYLLHAVQTDESHSGELNFASRDFGGFRFIAGYYYYHDKAAYDPLQIDRDVAPLEISIFGRQKAVAHSGYGEATYDITDRLTAVAGIRYSTERRSVSGTVSPGLTFVATTPFNDLGSVSFDAWTPRLSLRYEIADRTNVYFTYSKGFKSGGYDVTNVLGANPAVGLKPALPEKLTAYEVGVKSAFSPAFDFSASAYYYDYKNQQVTAFANVGGVVLGVTGNAAASEIYGLDFEARANLSDEFSLRTGVSLVHARFSSFPSAVVNIPNPAGPFGLIEQNRDVTGNRIPRTPDWTVSLGGQYRKEFSSGTLTLKADLFLSDKFYFDSGNIFAQGAYENLDASIAWSLPDDRFTFTLWGRNLTDQVTISGTNIGARSGLRNWAPPRTYGISVATKF